MLSQIAQVLAVIVALAAIAVAIYALFRSKTAEVLRGERDAYAGKCERLDEELKLLKEESHAKDIVITDLQAKTDLTEITKAQVAILANQTAGKALAGDIQNTLSQLLITMQAMEKRLDQGLVMGSK